MGIIKLLAFSLIWEEQFMMDHLKLFLITLIMALCVYGIYLFYESIGQDTVRAVAEEEN